MFMNLIHGYDMDRAQLPLNALRAFEAAARHLNISRAAMELCVSQGAVSHQIAALEKRLGVTLFRRQPRGLVLTDEGRSVATQVPKVLTQVLNGHLSGFSHGECALMLSMLQRMLANGDALREALQHASPPDPSE